MMNQQDNNEDPISPMKKLKILTEKQVNVIQPRDFQAPLKVQGPGSVGDDQESQPSSISPSISNSSEELPEEKLHQEQDEKKQNIEPLLEEAPGQYVIFPINHHDMWAMYKKLVDNFWSPTDTLEDLDKLGLNYNETKFIKYFSSIFASSESQGLVNENFAEDFCRCIQVTEAKFFYGHQLFVQNIHYEMYNKLVDWFFTETNEKNKFFKIVENFDSVQNKRQWVAQWKHSSFGEQIMASAIMHGLLFSSLDLVINWLRARKHSQFEHELIDIFEKMVLDQSVQRDFSCLMMGHLKQKPSKETIVTAIHHAAKLEFDFLLNGLSADLIDMDANEIIQIIDTKTKDLKIKMFEFYEDGSTGSKIADSNSTDQDGNVNTRQEAQEQAEYLREEHKRITFDEDF